MDGPKSGEASEKFEPRNHELQESLSWFIEHHELDSAVLLASLLWRSWMDKGHLKEGRQLTNKLLAALSTGQKRGVDYGELLFGAGMLAFRQEDNGEAERLFQECLANGRQADSKKLIIRSLTGLSRTALRDNNFAKVRERSGEARRIAKEIGDEYLETRPLHMLAAATKMVGDLGRARELYEESLTLSRKLGDQPLESVELDNLGSVSLQLGDLSKAKDWYKQAGQLMYKLHDKYLIPYLPLHFGAVALEEGKLERAVKLMGASEALFESGGMSPDPDETAGRDRTVAELRKKVDQNTFHKKWAEGKKLSLEEAVKFSLET